MRYSHRLFDDETTLTNCHAHLVAPIGRYHDSWCLQIRITIEFLSLMFRAPVGALPRSREGDRKGN